VARLLFALDVHVAGGRGRRRRQNVDEALLLLLAAFLTLMSPIYADSTERRSWWLSGPRSLPATPALACLESSIMISIRMTACGQAHAREFSILQAVVKVCNLNALRLPRGSYLHYLCQSCLVIELLEPVPEERGNPDVLLTMSLMDGLHPHPVCLTRRWPPSNHNNDAGVRRPCEECAMVST
jgi:hypothetical protein